MVAEGAKKLEKGKMNVIRKSIKKNENIV